MTGSRYFWYMSWRRILNRSSAGDGPVFRRVHGLDESLKQYHRIMRPWASLGVVLDRKRPGRLDREALAATVVEVDVRHLGFRRQALGIDGVPVVMRADLDPARGLVNHR